MFNFEINEYSDLILIWFVVSLIIIIIIEVVIVLTKLEILEVDLYRDICYPYILIYSIFNKLLSFNPYNI